MISTPLSKLRNPPIVEAVFDVDCDLPPALDLAALEGPARALLANDYPRFHTQLMHELNLEAAAQRKPNVTTRMAVQSLQFRHGDEKQLVQLRAQGFSFNRLAPYTSLDDYLPEIERTWRLYVDLVSPVKVRTVRLRYINRIHLPTKLGEVDLDDFFKIGPRLPDETGLILSGFLNQQSAFEKETGLQVNWVLTGQGAIEDKLAVILDITVASPVVIEPTDWPTMQHSIAALRSLKNRVFENTLTPKCIELFQ